MIYLEWPSESCLIHLGVLYPCRSIRGVVEDDALLTVVSDRSLSEKRRRPLSKANIVHVSLILFRTFHGLGGIVGGA